VSRARIAFGVVAVISGTAWALGGMDTLTTVARRLAELLPLMLVLGGVSAILLVAVPRGTLAGPVLLISVGLLGIAAERGMLSRSLLVHLPAFVLIGVGVIVAMSRRQNIQIDTGVKRYTAIVFPAHPLVSGDAPRKVIARAIFGLLRLDMSQAGYPPVTRLSIDVTCVLGRVEVILPKDWEVQAGRIELARQMTFGGTLSCSNLAPLEEQEEEFGKNLVVLNVLGWSGSVLVEQSKD
jgi:hypothetical protein